MVLHMAAKAVSHVQLKIAKHLMTTGTRYLLLNLKSPVTNNMIRNKSWRQQWNSLTLEERVQHTLSNSLLYRSVRKYKKLAANAQPMVKINEEHTSK